MAKLFCSRGRGRCADRVVQVFGGRGYVRTTAAERLWRELRVDRIWEGTSEVQRMIVARSPGAARRPGDAAVNVRCGPDVDAATGCSHPASVAVVGATDRPGAYGAHVLANLLPAPASAGRRRRP